MKRYRLEPGTQLSATEPNALFPDTEGASSEEVEEYLNQQAELGWAFEGGPVLGRRGGPNEDWWVFSTTVSDVVAL